MLDVLHVGRLSGNADILRKRTREQVRFLLTESEKQFDGTPMLEKTLKLLREMETLIPENA